MRIVTNKYKPLFKNTKMFSLQKHCLICYLGNNQTTVELFQQ